MSTFLPLADFLEHEVYPRLAPEYIYTDPAHQWKHQSPRKWQGGCPWHDSKRFLSPFGDMTLWNILAFRMVIPYIYLCPCATNLRLWGYIFSVAPETSSIEGGDRFHLDISYDHPCPLVT